MPWNATKKVTKTEHLVKLTRRIIKHKNSKPDFYYSLHLPEKLRKKLGIKQDSKEDTKIYMDVGDKFEEDGQYIVCHFWREKRDPKEMAFWDEN